MRLFVAIDVPENVKEHLAFLQRSVECDGLRLVHPKNIHLSLNYLGEVPKIDNIIESLRLITFHQFTLQLDRNIGFFPDKEHPKVLWVGLQENEELLKLQRQIDLLFKPKKSFKAHMTIGRVKKTTEENKIQLIKQAEQLNIKKLSFKVNSFKLFKSNLTKMGPIYEVIETFKAKE